MAITNSGGVRAGAAIRPLRRKGSPSRPGDRFVPEGVEAAAHEAAPEPTAVSAPFLLAMQETAAEPGPIGGRAQALRRGEDLLDRLDGLRLAMAAGAVAPDRLDELVVSLEAERTASDDPRLDILLAEIELRAAVELAKLGRRRARSLVPPELRNDQLLHLFSEPLMMINEQSYRLRPTAFAPIVRSVRRLFYGS